MQDKQAEKCQVKCVGYFYTSNHSGSKECKQTKKKEPQRTMAKLMTKGYTPILLHGIPFQ